MTNRSKDPKMMEHDGGLSALLYNWMNSTLSTSSGVAKLAFVVVVIAFTSEAVSALYKRLRDRPLFWAISQPVTLAIHNVLAALCHGLHLTFTFVIMVVVMTLDPWIWLSVISGGVLGHLVCHWKFSWPRFNYMPVAVDCYF